VRNSRLGALLGHLVKRHEEKELGVELDDYFPPKSSTTGISTVTRRR
jgi:hypothetical protein